MHGKGFKLSYSAENLITIYFPIKWIDHLQYCFPYTQIQGCLENIALSHKTAHCVTLVISFSHCNL